MLSQLRSQLPSNLILLMLIALMVIANVYFVLTSVLPHWRAYEELSARMASDEEAMQPRADDEAANDMRTVIEAQVNTTAAKRDTTAQILLTPAEADSFVDRLYSYATAYCIDIVRLEAQEVSQTTVSGIYAVRAFHLQAEGSLRQLIEAIAAMQDISLPSIRLKSIHIGSNATRSVLDMTILIYTSPYALGGLLQLRADEIALTDTPSLIPSVELLPVSTPMISVETPIVPIECPGALPTHFRAGDTVAVDFNAVGALRILKQPSGFDTLTQVYDGTELRLLEGPVCGNWSSKKILYWLVELDNTQGWVGEGDTEDRWLCPLSNPECA